jgi:FkbM family methyltransferase
MLERRSRPRPSKRRGRAGSICEIFKTERIAAVLATRRSWFWGLLFDLLGGVYRIHDLKITIPRSLTARSFRSQFFWHLYESDERRLIDQFVREQDRVLELGGCLGVISCLTNRKLVDPRSHVVVEANGKLISCLTENRKSNRCGFHIVHGMISRSSTGRFYIHDEILDGSGVERTDAGVPVVSVNVPVYTIDQIESEYGMRFNVVIMDIEGGELSFIEENTEFLRRIDLLIVELHRPVIGQGVARAVSILREQEFINIESLGASEVWVKASRLGIAAPRVVGEPATVDDLPSVAAVGSNEVAWDGIDGLYVGQAVTGSSTFDVVPLQLVATEAEGRHRLGIRFALASGADLCRLVAIVRPKIATRVYLEVRDGSSTNYGIATYDLKTRSCIRAEGDLVDVGVDTAEEGWVKIWCELPCSARSAAAYVGLASPAGDVSYRGDGRSGCDFLRFKIEPRQRV